MNGLVMFSSGSSGDQTAAVFAVAKARRSLVMRNLLCFMRSICLNYSMAVLDDFRAIYVPILSRRMP